MKILICGFTKIKYMPYINFYLGSLDENADVHVLYWNRDEKEENLSDIKATFHEFKKFQLDDCSKLSKIKNFKKYRAYAEKTINEIKPDKIIVLHSLPAVLLRKTLLNKYKDKYIFDYRDYTYECFGVFADAVKSLVLNSYKTFVSSDGFRKYLPTTDKIITSHNIDINAIDAKIEKTESDKIRIAFWGFIRDYETNKNLIKLVSSDTRFELHYYGREQEIATKLKEYVAKELKAENIFFHGEYKPADRYEFAAKTDIIDNYYDYKGAKLAMGNKYYDGITMKLPQVLNPEAFMGRVATEAGVGIAIPLNAEFLEKLHDYYTNLNKEELENNCKIEEARVLKEYRNGQKIVAEFSAK